jgi:hypothetical protein
MESPAICDGMQNPWFGLRNQRHARLGVMMNRLISLFEYAKREALIAYFF